MGDLSRRELLKLGAAAGAGAVVAPALPAWASGAQPASRPGGRPRSASSPRAKLTGRIVRPRDPGYEKARAGWDGLFSSYPLVIVFAQRTQDVVNALTWARQRDVALRVRSGRHSLEGWSNLDGGIVIDVSELKDTRIDASARTAKVGAGLTQGETVARLGDRGFAVPTGTEGTVGLAGATLGGGFGVLTRRFGLACDNLIGAKVVVPAGRNGARAIRVDRHHHADLLWALRGAGNGNFGIVTSLTYRLHRLSRVAFLTAKWDGLGDLQAVFDAWQRHTPAADNRLTSVLEIDPNTIQLYALLSSGSPAEARRMVAPVLAAGSPEVSVKGTTWSKLYTELNSGPRSYANWKFLSQFIAKPFPAEAIRTVGKHMARAPSAPSNFFCSSFGGAVSKGPRGGSAFPHRDAIFYAEPGAGWNGEATTAAAQAWVAQFGRALHRYTSGAYVNVPNAGMSDWGTAYWGKKYPRLREIKAKYDPDNVFQFEQSIPPANC